MRFICIAVGVSSVIASVNYAASGRAKIVRQLQDMGTDLITIRPKQSIGIAGRSRTGKAVTTLVQRDLWGLKKNVSGLVANSPLFSGVFPAKAGDNNKSALTVVGCSSAYFAMKRWQLAAGVFFDKEDERRLAKTTVLGARLANDLFGEVFPVGKTVLINRVGYQVKGVLAERGQGRDAASEDEEAFIPLTTATRRLGNVDYFSAIVLQVKYGSLGRAMDDAGATMRLFHRQSAKRVEDYEIQSAISLLSAQKEADERLDFIVRLAGTGCLILLASGSLCLAWLTVIQRMPEWGILRLIGASRSDVLAQISFEFSVVSIAGCSVGLALGVGSARLLALRSGLPPVMDWSAIFEAFLVAIALNLVFAVLPAQRAAKLDPM